ncbi:MAG: DUF2953 domain-containing protein [Bacillota bacterium]
MFLVLIQLIPLQFEVAYRRGEEDHYLITAINIFNKLRVFRLRISLEVPKQSIFLKAFGMMKKYAPGFEDILEVYRVFRRFLSKVQCRRLHWVTEIGLADPASTGMAIGGVWTVKSMIVQQFYRTMQMRVQKPNLQVIPSFTKPKLHQDFQCIFALRIGHITSAICGLIWWMASKRWTGKG